MAGNKKLLLKDSFLCTLFSSVVAILFYLIAINISALDPFEKAFKDFSFTDLYYSNKFYTPEPTRKIILVNVKHHDRATIAMGIEKIASHNPSAIGIDIIFKDRREPAADAILKEVLNSTPAVVCAYYIDGDRAVENHSYFSEGKTSTGFINFDHDAQEGVIREFLGTDNRHYGFATQVAIKAGALSRETAKEKLNESLPIRYVGNEANFLTFDIDEVIASESIPALSNSIVLLGYLGNPTSNKFDIEDKHFTPLNPKYVGKSVPDMHGVVVHANILTMLTQDSFLTKIPKAFSYLFAFLICWLLTFMSMRLSKRSAFVSDVMIKIFQLLVVVILVYFALLLLHWNAYLWIAPILILTVLGLELIPFYQYLQEYLAKRFRWKN